MATNLIPQFNPTSSTHRGITYTWNTAKTQCHVQGTSTNISWNNVWMAGLAASPLDAGHTYEVKFSTASGNVHLRGYFYDDANFTTLLGQFNFVSDGQFTVPTNCGGLVLRIWEPSGVTVNETVAPEIYDITYTDVDADCDMMMSVVGYPNSWFYPKWIQFASAQAWDGESCSEIACCISYMAGNLSKIYVSNYAQGLADLFRANGRFGTTASRGAFMWWDYDGDGVPDHSGRVYEILPDGTIHTVEGNVGGLVVERYYSPNDPTIFGYGYPNYDNDPATDPGDPTPPKFIFVPYWRHQRRGR